MNCVEPRNSADWQSGQSITLERDDDYFDATQRAKTKTVEFVIVRDPSAVVSGLLAGSIDGAWSVDPAAIGRRNRAVSVMSISARVPKATMPS